MFDYEKYLLFERIKKGEHISEIDLTGLNMSDEIEPNSLEELERYNGWKLNIERAKDKKVRFYIVEKDSVDKYGWEGIHQRNLYNVKYLLDIAKLDSLNWTITYNGEQFCIRINNNIKNPSIFKEFQDELDLNVYAMDWRQYDPALGRWTSQDPVTHHSLSPYNAFDNNPVFWADPSGADATALIRNLWNNSGSGMTTWTNNGDNTFSQTSFIDNSFFENIIQAFNITGEEGGLMGMFGGDVVGTMTYSLLAGNTHQITFNQVLYDKTRTNSYGVLRDRITSSTTITIQLNNQKAIFNTTLVTANSTLVKKAFFGNKCCPECGTNIRETKFSGLSGNPYADAAAVFIGNQIQANPNYNLFNQSNSLFPPGTGLVIAGLEKFGSKSFGLLGISIEAAQTWDHYYKAYNDFTGSYAHFNVLRDGTLILQGYGIR